MSLTSPGLVLLLAALAGALVAGVVIVWPALARRGVGWVVGRIMVVCVVDVVVLCLILAIANRTGDFYATWSELFGTEHVSGHVIELGRGPVTARSMKGHSDQIAITARFAVSVRGHPRIQGGRLLTVTMTGPVSGLVADGFLYVPDAALWATARRADYPVIVIISDRFGARTAASFARQIASTAALQIAVGGLRPALVVMLPADIAPGAGRSCLDVPGGPQTATFFAQDLPELIQSGFPASTSPALWAVLGDGTGGYCALQLALTHSAAYSVAAAPPGSYTPQAAPGKVGPTRPLRQQENLIYLLRHQPMQPVSVLLTGRLVAALPVLALARAPMRVAITPQADGKWPLARVLDWIGRSLGTEP